MINCYRYFYRHIPHILALTCILLGCVPAATPASDEIPEMAATYSAIIPATGTYATTLALPVVSSDTFTPTEAIITSACTCTPTLAQAFNLPMDPTPTSQPLSSGQAPAPTQMRPIFDQFVEKVKNGNARQIVGVYMEDLLGLRVVQQPLNQPAFVSPVMGVATQFLLAFEVAGNIGLLAHNYLSGQHFFFLNPGNIAQIINGDGNVREYEVTAIYQYQALSPLSPTSDFLDLNTNQRLTASALFNLMYMGEHHLTFQTCIAQGNDDSWGRLFVIADPF